MPGLQFFRLQFQRTFFQKDIAAIALKVDADAAANVRFDGISIFMCQTIKPSDRSRDECIANMNQALSTVRA